MGTKYLREAWGMTQTQLATVLGCSKHAIAQHESSGRAIPKHATGWLDELDDGMPPAESEREGMQVAVAAGQCAFWRWNFRREDVHAGYVTELGQEDENQTELVECIEETKRKFEHAITGLLTPASSGLDDDLGEELDTDDMTQGSKMIHLGTKAMADFYENTNSAEAAILGGKPKGWRFITCWLCGHRVLVNSKNRVQKHGHSHGGQCAESGHTLDAREKDHQPA
ncbi:MAG: helix-turn-helix transcriptional regulator [Deltaproteobacteria bacterium]|nr:helix-turn-helix transcriptional regulator [Deltaproteobacteria bacterium]